jgi:hypothetical protein
MAESEFFARRSDTVSIGPVRCWNRGCRSADGIPVIPKSSVELAVYRGRVLPSFTAGQTFWPRYDA